MLVVHWSPVNNTKRIIRSGISKSQTGLYCFPLTGNHNVDTWWIKMFNRCRGRKRYNGFIFRLEQNYFPAYFGHWMGSVGENKKYKPIQTVAELQKEYRETVLWRIGERLGGYSGIESDWVKVAMDELLKDPDLYNRTLTEVGFMEYIFEDYQIVLSTSIPANRIIKIIPGGDEFGHVTYKRKKYSNDD